MKTIDLQKPLFSKYPFIYVLEELKKIYSPKVIANTFTEKDITSKDIKILLAPVSSKEIHRLEDEICVEEILDVRTYGVQGYRVMVDFLYSLHYIEIPSVVLSRASPLIEGERDLKIGERSLFFYTAQIRAEVTMKLALKDVLETPLKGINETINTEIKIQARKKV